MISLLCPQIKKYLSNKDFFLKKWMEIIIAHILDVEETRGGDDARATSATSTCHQLPVAGYDRKRKEREKWPNRKCEQESRNEKTKSQESHQGRTESDPRCVFFQGLCLIIRSFYI